MLHDSIIAAIRTGVATLVGLVAAYLVAHGFELDDTFKVNLITALTILFTALYNWFVILLSEKVNPLFGYLLGVPKTPSYKSSAGPNEIPSASDITDLESSH